MPLSGKFHLAHRERAESVRIARDDHAFLRQKHERERAFQLQQGITERARKRALA